MKTIAKRDPKLLPESSRDVWQYKQITGWGFLERFRVALGYWGRCDCLLRRHQAQLGASWSPLVLSWGILGTVLGASWAVFGAY